MASVLGLLSSLAGVPSGIAPASAALTPPTFLRHIGQPGHAGTYAWGMATAVDGTILVGDYWNYQVRRFSTSGQLLQSFSQKGTDPGENMAPHGLAVDRNDGSIYMADQNFTWRIHKFAADGTYLHSMGTYVYGVTNPYPYVTRVQVLSDGNVLALSSHNIPSLDGFSHRVLKFAPDGKYIGSWGVNGSAPGQLGLQRGFAVGPDDEVYLGDATKHVIQVFTSDGVYLRSLGSGRFAGDMRGLAVDFENRWLYAVDAAGSQIEKFTLAGTHLAVWGSEGTGPGQFRDGGREITVGPDQRVYVADFGNNRVNIYRSDGTYEQFFPNPAIQPPPGGFNQPQDVAVTPGGGSVYVADTYNHRVHRFGADGEVVDVWGFRGSTGPDALNYPRGVAVEPGSGNVWVMNSREGNAKVYNAAGAFLRSHGSWGSGPGQTNLARGIHVDGTGRVYVADSNNQRLQVLDQRWDVLVNVPCGGPAPPPPSIALLKGCTGIDTDASGNIYAAAPTEHTVYKFNSTGRLLRKIGTGPGSGNGQLRGPYDLAVAGNQLLVTESNNARVSVFTLAGAYVGRFGTKGEGDGQFGQPRGIDIDSSRRAYIVDGTLERVSVFQLK